MAYQSKKKLETTKEDQAVMLAHKAILVSEQQLPVPEHAHNVASEALIAKRYLFAQLWLVAYLNGDSQ